MRKSIKIILILLNAVLALVYMLSCLATRVDPSSNFLFPILGLFFPLWFFLHVFFFIFWIMFRKIYLLISLGVILLFLPVTTRFMQFHFKNKHDENAIRIMTWNVKNFDLYNWSHNKDTRTEMMKLIETENPDVLCLQEFYNEDQGDFMNIDQIKNELNYPYYYFSSSVTLRDNDHWGIATFSKYPIDGSGNVEFGNSITNKAIYTDVRFPTETIRVFNTHLQSVYFDEKDYQYLEEVEDINPDVKSSKRIFGKLLNAYSKRAEQARLLKSKMNESELPVILCGDFNDTPVSYAYETLSKNLQDSFKKRGKFFGRTYNGNIPLLRIDYVLLDKSFEVVSHQVIHKNFSDHFAVVAEFGI